jgi:ATP-dependent protease Clp ATPase subunit
LVFSWLKIARWRLMQVKPEDLEAFGLLPELIGRLLVIAPLDALGVDGFFRF